MNIILRYIMTTMIFLPLNNLWAIEEQQHLYYSNPSPNLSLKIIPANFEQMLVYVYQNNPKLASERDALKIADEKVAEANAGYRPSLNANAATGRQREKIIGQNWQYGDDTSDSLVAVQPIFNGFGTLEQKRAAEARVLAARAHLLSTEQNILLTAIFDWLDICEKEKILALNYDNRQRMYKYLEGAQQLFKAGDGTTTDIAQAQSRLAQADTRYAMSKADRDSARATFERDTGLIAQVVEFPSLPRDLPITSQEAVSRAANNPQLTQLDEEQIAAEHDIGTAESSLWPSVSLNGSTGEDQSPVLGLEKQRTDSLTINISIPLYQGGAEYARVREAKIEREKIRHDAVDFERDVKEHAKISWNNYYAALQVITTSQRASAAAITALNGVQEEQRQGLRTMTEVLDEQSELINADITEIEAQKNVRLEAYRLLAATGRLTATGLNLPVERYDPKPHHDDVIPRWVGF